MAMLSSCFSFGGNSSNHSSQNSGSSSGNTSQTTSSGSSSGSSSSSTQTVSLTLSKSSLTLSTGESETITATATGGTGSVTWSSSNTSIATVNNGTILGVSGGTATITASYSGETATCSVTVTAASLTLNKTSLSLSIGDDETLVATASGGTGPVTWSSSNTAVAKVNSSGNVVGFGVGNTTVKASYSGIIRSCTVSITSAATVTLNKTSTNVGVGSNTTLEASTTGGSGSVTWSSNNTSVATVSNGVVSGHSAGTAIITASYCGVQTSCSVLVTSGAAPVKPASGTTTINVWATNDFHGAIEESGNNMGLAKWATYLKDKGEQNNTLLLDQGDTWQGSIYSNYNHGALITDVMNYIHYDARSVGNHDFDWGAEQLAANTAMSYNGYSTPVLAGNVTSYDLGTHSYGSTQQATLGRKSVTYTLENGLKVGILGGIGQDQITSICASFTKDIYFSDHVAFIKEEATRLRNQENCDLIIASIHTPQNQVMGNSLEDYVDLVLCGHSHNQETGNEGNLWYNQNKAYGMSIGQITLTYNYATGKVTNTDIAVHESSEIMSSVTEIEPTVQSLITSYKSTCDTEASEMMASNINGYFPSGGEGANLMAKAIFDKTVSEGYTVDLVMVNSARKAIYSYSHPSSWTFAEIYESFPFDNIIYIANVKGSELKKEIPYNYIYRNSTMTNNTISSSGTYRIAVIDYLYLHIGGNNHACDYFAVTGGTSTTTLSKNYREIIRDWLKANHYNAGTQLSSDDYSSSLWAFNKGNFTYE